MEAVAAGMATAARAGVSYSSGPQFGNDPEPCADDLARFAMNSQAQPSLLLEITHGPRRS
jgi:hypothetical protein